MIIAKSTDSGTRKLLSGNFIWEVRTESPFLILKATWVNSGRTHITAVSASLWKPPSPAWTKATDSSTGQLPPCRALPLRPARSPPLSNTDYVTLSAYPCPPGLWGKPAPHSGLRGFEWLGLCLALCGISRPPSRSPGLTGLLSLLKPAKSVLADPSPCKPLPADPGPSLLAGGYGSAQLSPLRPCWLK